MAKKWKLGVKYQFKDKAGFQDACTVNHHIVELIDDSVFSIVCFDFDKDFTRVSLSGKEIELPYGISRDERKFFKVVKEKFVAGGQYALIDRKGFINAHAGNQEIAEKIKDGCCCLIQYVTDTAAMIEFNDEEFYLLHKETKYFERID